MKYTKAIGIRLDELLKKENLTQTQFAQKSKISRMTINSIIKGRVKLVTFEILLIIFDTLNITVKEFFTSDIFQLKFEETEKNKGRKIQQKG